MAIATGREANAGQRNEAPEWEDFVHTGPGTLAGRYLRMFWHPIARLEDLKPGWTKPVRLMGEDFTLYRGESGAPHLVAFRCAHRATQLSAGWVEGDDLRCYYHGWKYDPAGHCLEQPGELEPFCSKIRIAGYPTEAYLGMVFIYLGEGQAPPLPEYPEIADDEGLLEVWREDVPCNYFNRLDNAADHVHVSFVHNNRNGKGQNIPFYLEVQETDYGYMCNDHPPGTDLPSRPHNRFQMPNLSYLYLGAKERALEEGRRIAAMWRVPVDDENHVVLGAQRVQVFGEKREKYQERLHEARLQQERFTIADMARAVLDGQMRTDDIAPGHWWDSSSVQDAVTMVGQDAIAHRELEHLGRSDVGVIFLRDLYRRELRALAEGRPLKQWTTFNPTEDRAW